MKDLTVEHVLNVFRMYIGLKLHFTNASFIYSPSFRENTINVHSMNKRNDIEMFINVADKFQNKNDSLYEHMISMFMMDKNSWIGSVLSLDVAEHNSNRMKNIYSLTNIVITDIGYLKDYMKDNGLDIKAMLDTNGDRPLIYKKLNLSNEFLSLLDFVYPYLYENNDSENPIWKKLSFSLYKYKHLINLDNSDVINIIQSELSL